jgi:hypothetical protein
MGCKECQRLRKKVGRLSRHYDEALALLEKNRLAFPLDYRRFTEGERLSKRQLDASRSRRRAHRLTHGVETTHQFFIVGSR